MTSMRVSLFTFTLLTVLISYYLHTPLQRQLTVLGVFRRVRQTPITHPEHLFVIEDTKHCEDLHYHAPSHTIFTACEDSSATRFAWFPPLAIFEDPISALSAKGSIHVIDPEKKTSRRLDLVGFEGPFITHGIDVITDPESDGRAVYIFAVNHVPHAEFAKTWKETGGGNKNEWKYPRTDPRIEIFRHVLGTKSAQHIRSTRHPLVQSPNDVVALSPTSYLVTNDHHYSHGVMRLIEDGYPGARWSTIAHVQCAKAQGAVPLNPDDGCDAAVALSGLQNNNGLGHGRSVEELLVVSTIGGVLHFGHVPRAFGERIELSEAISFDSVIDNPTYFVDPYANASYDASGYVLAGLSRAIDLPKTSQDPLGKEAVMVWDTRPRRDHEVAASAQAWDTRLIFEDDGSRIRSASAAILVAIDPKVEEQQRTAWLFVSGFLSDNAIAVKVDL